MSTKAHRMSVFVSKAGPFFAISFNHKHGAEFLQLSTKYESFSEAQAKCRLLNAPNGSLGFKKKEWVLTS